MLFAATLSREQLIGWLGGQFEPPIRRVDRQQLAHHLNHSGAILVWRDKPEVPTISARPPLVAVPRADVREFFAFVGTYVSTYQPFSAFFRVLPLELLSRLPELERDAVRVVPPNHLLGAVIAEAKLQAGEKVRTLSDLTVQACLATVSGAAVAGLAQGLDLRSLDSVFLNWSATRRRLTDENLRVDISDIHEFWRIVFTVFEALPLQRLEADEPTRRIIDFVLELLGDPDNNDPKGWYRLTDGLINSRVALASMKQSREDRIRAFDKLVPELTRDGAIDFRIRAIVAGYLASRLGGGSMSYLQVLSPIEGKLPIASLWFGFFSSLFTGSDVLTAGECLGRRLERHVTNRLDLFLPPTSDISYDELDAFFPVGRSDFRIRTEHSGSIDVEIFPAISSIFRWPRDRRRDQENSEPIVSAEAVNELEYLAERLVRAIARMGSSKPKAANERPLRKQRPGRQPAS